MELVRLLKMSIPEIKVYRRKTETWSIRTQSFVKKTLRQDISIMDDSSWKWQETETWLSMILTPAYAIAAMLS